MAENNHSGHLLLLVDDEEDIRDVLQLPLEDLGYTVFTAENAETALSLFQAEAPDIVLTDIKMPGMDGIELLQKIKKASPDTEVIMITGHGDMDLAIKSLKYEATDFVIKPINIDTLEIALDRAEEHIRTRRQLREHTRNLEILIQEKAEMQDHLYSLGLLIGSVSHGIKGLLTRLDGGIYFLEAGIEKGDADQIEQGRTTLKETAKRIKKLVQDILHYAKERTLRPEAVETDMFVDDIVATAMARIGKTAIDLTVDTKNAPTTVHMEPDSMHSALVSILDNAIDACKKDHAKTAHRVRFSVAEEGRKVVFVVGDNGVGMDPDTRDRLFTLFFSSKGRHGTGLGLFIANKIVGQHKGTLTVESEPGRGSSFRISIPSISPCGPMGPSSHADKGLQSNS